MAKSPSKSGSRRDDYATPWSVINWLEDRFGNFDLDPCCKRSTAKAPKFITEAGNALGNDARSVWQGNVFMNPPWSQPLQARFVEHAYAVACSGIADQVVGLIPSCNMDTIAWHKHILSRGAHEVIFVRGRISFLLDGVVKPNSSVPTAFPIWRLDPPKAPRIFTVSTQEFKKYE